LRDHVPVHKLVPVPELAEISANLEIALNHCSIPAYVLDTSGVVRWLNEAAIRIVGDVRGRQFTSLVAPEEVRHVREAFARKVAGRTKVTDFDSVVCPETGARLGVQVSSVPLITGDRVVGVFGQVARIDYAPRRFRRSTSRRGRWRCCACSSAAGRRTRSHRSCT